MGRLNSNEIPPNPFVHGWNTPAEARPAQPSTPPPPPPLIVSPLERTLRIVSQPLPSVTRSPRRNFSFGWLTAFFLPIGLICAFIICKGLLFNAPVPLNSHQASLAANHIANPSGLSQAHSPNLQPQSTAKLATASASVSVPAQFAPPAPAEPSRASLKSPVELSRAEGDSAVLARPGNVSAPIPLSANIPKASLAPIILKDAQPDSSRPSAHFEPTPSPIPSTTARFPMAPRLPKQSAPSVVSTIPQNPVPGDPPNTDSYPLTQSTPFSGTPANVYSYPTAQPAPRNRPSSTQSTPFSGAPANVYSYPTAQPAPRNRPSSTQSTPFSGVPANVYSYATGQSTPTPRSPVITYSYSTALRALPPQSPHYYLVAPTPPASLFRGASVYGYSSVSGYRIESRQTFAMQPQIRGQGMGRSGRR